MIPARLSRTFHKWLALIVGAQVLLWVASGFYTAAWFPIAEIRARYQAIEQIHIKALPGFDRPLYEVRSAGGVILADATTGEPVSPLDEKQVATLARQYYAGHGSIASTELLVGDAPLEIQSRPLPLWCVRFDDWLETTLYIHPDSGELVTRRHRLWHWFDAPWMLHTMDYRGRDDFNNPLVILFSTDALWLGISGGLLLFQAFRPLRRPDSCDRARAGAV